MKLKFAVETHVAPNGATVEVATVTHDGQSFSALGAVVDHPRGVVVGYVSADETALQTFDGKHFGTLRVTGSYRALGSLVRCYRATIDGREYHGRGGGPGLLLMLRARKTKDE